MTTMRGWSIAHPARGAAASMELSNRPVPRPGPGDIVVKISACGVCRTDLHLVEGDLEPRRAAVVPGHQVVGRVHEVGAGVDRFVVGDRVGIAWLRRTCGECRWCRAGSENLCPRSEYTGWDADGGFAEYTTVPSAYAYRLPSEYADHEVAPLLCAGIIGYRALRRAAVPPGGRLGIYGFGSSAHITAQIAVAQGAELFVMTRGERSRALAVELGASFVGHADAPPPEPLDSAIIFAPAGELVPAALEALGRGGTLALAGIHMSDIPTLDYARHLFKERDLRTVTSNTRRDGEELLQLATRLKVRVRTTLYGFEETPRALADLARGDLSGSAVITMP